MNISRRQFLQSATSLAAATGLSKTATALDYPTKPVHLIVGYPAGGPTDIGARLIGQFLSERLGQQFLIENKPGANGNIGTEAVIKAIPDGYTLLQITVANVINPYLYGKPNFNFTQDIAPVASIWRQPLVMEVNPALPVGNVKEFIAYAKANPGKINMASAGIGSPQHIAGELFKMMAGVDMLHVPYRGAAPALTDLISGQVQVCFDTISSSIGHINNGSLRPLAVTTATRSEVLPGLPTVGDYLTGFEASGWAGMGAPRGTSADIIGTLNEAVNSGLASAKIKAQMAAVGATAFATSPAEFGKFMAAETEKWAKVIRAAGLMQDGHNEPRPPAERKASIITPFVLQN